MRTTSIVRIECDDSDLRSNRAFERAAEFTGYDTTITIACGNGREMTFQCSPIGDGHSCWGWRYFRAEWERRFGRIT